MKIIHCTQKLLRLLKRDITPIDKILSNPEGLGNWYANLLWFNRKKCILFTNEKSLYTFLVPKVVKHNLDDIETEFVIHLAKNLQYEGISLEAINKINQEYFLGSMNDLAYQCEYFVMRDGGIEKARILQINHKLNRTPMSAIKYRYPIDELKGMLNG
jgi:hypothetical protein